jgi:uncharacterized protein (TIGR02118 family)
MENRRPASLIDLHRRGPTHQESNMEVCLFVTATARDPAIPRKPDEPAAITRAELAALLPSIPDWRCVVLHTPVAGVTHDPAIADEPPPAFTIQFYFDELDALEATLRSDGPLAALLDPQRFPRLADCALTHQAMAVRHYPVAAPGSVQPGETRCSHLVGYEGPAEDFNAWIGHYLDRQPPIVARLPGVRDIEAYTRLDYRCELPMPRSYAMQRNKMAFDSVDALNAALASPVHHEMREDFKRFPPFSGAVLQCPMLSTGWRRARR